jgi:hypothetical protein
MRPMTQRRMSEARVGCMAVLSEMTGDSHATGVAGRLVD